jgi:hypothetical protein
MYFLFSRSKAFAYVAICLLCIGLSLCLLAPIRNNSGAVLETFLVIVSLAATGLYVSSFDRNELKVCGNIIAYTGICVALVSYFEQFLFADRLSTYWEHTGGFRSVSTLLNPNNLGMYLAASAICLFFSPGIILVTRIFGSLLIFGAILLSGSRTAIASLLFASLLGFVYKGNMKLRQKGVLIVCFLIIVAIGLGFSSYDQLSAIDRLSDLQTGDIRFQKYMTFLGEIHPGYLLPDFSGQRAWLTSESGYFHFFNSLGVILSSSLLFSLLCHGRLRSPLISDHNGSHRVFEVLLLFYAFAMISENVLMSFPNNQLFAISLAVVSLCKRSGGPYPSVPIKESLVK